MRAVMRGLWVVLSLLAAGDALADDSDHPRDDGLMLTAGAGNEYAGLGVEASYPLRVEGTLYRAGPFVGVGANRYSSHDRAMAVWSLGAGVRGSWGLRHRVVAALGVVPVLWRVQSLHGFPVGLQPVHRPTLAGGYEYVSNAGFVGRVTAGAASNGAIVLNLGLGAKLW